MKFVVLYLSLLFFILTNGFVRCVPKEYKYPSIVTLYATEDDSEELNVKSHKVIKKSISDHSSFEEGETQNDTQEPCRLSLPTLDNLSDNVQDTYSDDGNDLQPAMEAYPPRIPSVPYIPFNKWTPYDFDYFVQNAQEPVESYDAVYNMPYFYESPLPPVKSLPPVINTRIFETIPESDDVYGRNSENDVFYQPYERSERSRDDDFLDQFEIDPTIPNVLPTMPFPYMRSGAPTYQQDGLMPAYPYQVTYSQGVPIMALNRATSESGCSLPFLFKCTPKTSYGTLTPPDYDEHNYL